MFWDIQSRRTAVRKHRNICCHQHTVIQKNILMKPRFWNDSKGNNSLNSCVQGKHSNFMVSSAYDRRKKLNNVLSHF